MMLSGMVKDKTIHSVDFKKNPYWFKALNAAWSISYPLGTEIKLTKDKLINAAKQNTGLNDLGKDFHDEPLERLLYSLNNESALHPAGRFITYKRLVNLISVRLRAEYYFKKHPEILEQQLYPVMLIIGLQRTGTTKLHRMLASDPGTRSLSSWEAINPAPMNGDSKTGAERIKFAKMSEKALKLMSPGFFAIHPIEHMAPEEDVLLLDVSFMSTTAEATMHVPSYAAWLETIDQSPSYEYAVKLMKLLQWQKPAEKWVLKSPHHLEFPHLAEKYFKDVLFIWTHRDVLEAIPSFASMLAHVRALFSNKVEPEQITKHWIRKAGYALGKTIEFRKNNEGKFIDVDYEDLVKDSLAVINKIYEKQNLEINCELIENFHSIEKNNPKSKYGVHKYKIEDFGINIDFINQHTKEYQEFQKKIEPR